MSSASTMLLLDLTDATLERDVARRLTVVESAITTRFPILFVDICTHFMLFVLVWLEI